MKWERGSEREREAADWMLYKCYAFSDRAVLSHCSYDHTSIVLEVRSSAVRIGTGYADLIVALFKYLALSGSHKNPCGSFVSK